MKHFIFLCSLVGCLGLAPAASAFPGFGFSVGPDGMRLDFEQGFLGIVLGEVDAGLVDTLKLPAERGALVKEVAPDTPAAKAGLEKDDVVVQFNDIRVESAMQLQRMVRETPAGRKVELGVFRQGADKKIALTVGSSREFQWSGRFEMPPRDTGAGDDDDDVMPPPSFPPFYDQRPRRGPPPDAQLPSLTPGAKPRLGVIIQPIGRQLAQFFGLKPDQAGVLVTSVKQGTAADNAGLVAGDVILEINGKSVAAPQDVVDRVSDAPAGQNKILLLRDRKEITVEVLFGDEEEEEIEDSI